MQPPRPEPRGRAARGAAAGPAADRAAGTAGERRRQLSQNFFRSAADAAAFAGQMSVPAPTPVVELGAGSGQVTQSLVDAGYPVLALEIDPYWADQLRQRRLDAVRVVTVDVLTWRPEEPVVLIGNLPFGAGTQILRHVLEFGPGLVREAVFLLQAEYVGKRVGRSGGNLFNAQWAPWYRFGQGVAFRREAFRPVPRADTATLLVEPYPEPALPWSKRKEFQTLAARIFNTGHVTIGEAARKALGSASREVLRRASITAAHPVKALAPSRWVALHREWSAHPRAGAPLRRSDDGARGRSRRR